MQIPLGFELKTGKAISIPLRHTAVIGVTQQSGIHSVGCKSTLGRNRWLRELALVVIDEYSGVLWPLREVSLDVVDDCCLVQRAQVDAFDFDQSTVR